MSFPDWYKHIITYEETAQQTYSSGREHGLANLNTKSVQGYFIQLIMKSQLQASYLYECMPDAIRCLKCACKCLVQLCGCLGSGPGGVASPDRE